MVAKGYQYKLLDRLHSYPSDFCQARRRIWCGHGRPTLGRKPHLATATRTKVKCAAEPEIGGGCQEEYAGT